MSEFRIFKAMVCRNIKLYFKDKGTFFTSLITPLILLALFITFLNNVYKTSLIEVIGQGVLDESAINAFTGGVLVSSLLGVCCVTVGFCSNMHVNDKINGAETDLNATPAKKTTIILSYFISNFITTFIICFIALVAGLIYLAIVGWYLNAVDILLIILNMILCILFGTLLSSIVGNFISSQGALGAVSSLVSSLYGFVSGAYMPISQFSGFIRNFVMFIPGTYGVILFRNYFMGGVVDEFAKVLPEDAVNSVKDGFDINGYFFGNQVEIYQMYLVLGLTTLVLLGIYLGIVFLRNKNK